MMELCGFRTCQRSLLVFFLICFSCAFVRQLATYRIPLTRFDEKVNTYYDAVIVENNDDKIWQLSDEWIHDCVRRNELKGVRKPYNVQWVDYRLGDCIRMCRACEASIRAALSFGNSSIAGQYWLNACKQENLSQARSKNFTYVSELFDQYKRDPSPYSDPWQVPAEDELVIHLRIGDVMDERWFLLNGSVTPFEMLRYGTSTQHGRSSMYPHGIKSISEYLDLFHQQDLRKIVFRGGPHKPKPYPKSKVYTRCLTEAIKEAGFTVVADVKGEHTPDQDFYYMSHAKHFVPGTGGYSQIICQMIKRLGGKVIVFPRKAS